MEKHNLFKDFVRFIKLNWKFFVLSNVFIVFSSFLAAIFEPIMRGINKAGGIVCLVAFVLLGTFSIVYNLIQIRKIDKNNNELNYKFLYYFSSITISGIFITIFALTIRGIDSDSQLLIEGFGGLLSLLIFYLVFGIVLFSQTLLKEDKE